ncbi:MAG: hypothetical protein ACREEM_27650 [Blastocatellia bacterium]
MDRIKIPTIALPSDRLKGEIDRWANSKETGDLAFLKAICRSFSNEAEKFFNAGATPEDRLRRLEYIRQALVEIGFKDGERTFTISGHYRIPPTSVDDLLDQTRKDCNAPKVCHAGACVCPENKPECGERA